MEATLYPGQQNQMDVYWPKPPEVPRYRYAGQLLGEANFVRTDQGSVGTGTRVLRWLVGLSQGRLRRPDNLVRPQSGTVGPDGTIYVTDAGRPAVFVFDMTLNRLQIWNRADQGQDFEVPVGIAVDPTGNLLVADAGLGRVVRLNTQGKPVGSFGGGALGRPARLAWSVDGVFVSDSTQHSIKVFDQEGRLIRTIGSRGSALGEFNGPTHLTLRGDQIFVSDTLNARIQVLTTEGQPLSTIGSRGLYVGNLTRPKGVAVDSDDHIYAVESYYDHLVIFDAQGHYLLPIGGAEMPFGGFFLPAGAWSDDYDRIFVADMYNARVLIFQYLGD